jgi:hypothetical protein
MNTYAYNPKIGITSDILIEKSNIILVIISFTKLNTRLSWRITYFFIFYV